MAVILFMMKYPLHVQENLQIKFDGQMAAARALGHEAWCIGWDREGMWLVGKGTRLLLKRTAFAHMPGYDHTKIFIDLMAAARKVFAQKKVDILYLRYMPTFSGAVKTISMLKAQGGRLIVEYPTYPKENGTPRFTLRRPVFAYTDQVMKRIHPMVDLYTLIGQPSGGLLDGCPAMNIVNGIQVDKLPLHAPNAEEDSIHLLALASMVGWHGYDRLIQSLAEYQGTKDIRIHMVGGEGDGSLAMWNGLVKRLGVEEKVIFHGALYGEALNRVVALCDVGIGCLAMFRFGQAQGMTLKLREYMARGLPFVYAADDPSIPQDERFSMKVTNDEAPIDMEKIIHFALQAKASPNVPLLMREYAKENMAWEDVLESILERLNA